MEKRSGKMRRQSAEVLNLIGDENPLLLDDYTLKKAAYIAAGWEDLVEEIEPKPNANEPDQTYGNIKDKAKDDYYEYSNIFVEKLNKPSKLKPKVAKTAEDWLKSAEANAFRPKFTPAITKSIPAPQSDIQFPDPEEFLDDSVSSFKIKNSKHMDFSGLELESWSPEDFDDMLLYDESDEEEQESADDDEEEQIDFESMNIADMKLKNITEIPWNPEYNTRKCAMGDGEFLNYSGKLYQCTCGTIYHEICLKTQAVFVGKCQICEREFRKLEK